MQIVYDAADGYVLMFGGDGAKLYNESWVFQNDTWREIFPAVSPPPIGGGGMVFDAKDGYVLLFGGQLSGYGMSNQTWTFLRGQWSQLSPSPSPAGRQLAGMAYDATDGYVLLFGGNDGVSAVYSDTWSFSGGNWTNRTPTLRSTPSPRDTSMTYDGADGYILLFGGYAAGGGMLNDTWKFSGGAWSLVTTAVSPYARWPVPIAYDAVGGFVLIFGSVGDQGTNGYQNDTWEYQAGTWTEVFGAQHPSGRWVSAMVYDPDLQSVVLYGGSQSTDLGDTWLFTAGNWSEWAPPNISYPSARSGPAMAYDASDGYVLMFGGSGDSGLLNDTWSYAAGTWTTIATTPSPPARTGAAMTYDSTDHYILLFGGSGASGPLNDTWRYSNGSWTSVAPRAGLAPPARAWAGIADDPADADVLLFGGLGVYDLSDSWSYVSGAWSRLGPSTSPTARHGTSMAYDPVIQHVVLFGGNATNSSSASVTRFSDSWKFGNGTWTPIPASIAPGARDGAGMAYLPTARDLILYGGSVGSLGAPSSETWEFNGTNWTPLWPSVSPGPSTYAGFAWESTSGALALFGQTGPGAAPATTWQFSYGTSNNSSGYPAVPLRVTTTAARSPSGSEFVVVLSSVVSGGRLPYSLQWIFGDGTQGSALPNSAVSHTYPGPGRFAAVLVVRDGSGQTSRIDTPVVVGSSAENPPVPTGTSSSGTVLLATTVLGVAVGALISGSAYLRRRRAERERREGDMLVRELRGNETDPPGPP